MSVEAAIEFISMNLPTVIAAIGAFAAAGGLIFTGLSYRQNSKSRYLQILKEFDNEITLLENSQQRNTDYPSFGAKYLNIHERIAYLALKRVIPNNIARYFDSSFAASLGILQKKEFERYADDLKNLLKWCKKKRILPSAAPEPHSQTK